MSGSRETIQRNRANLFDGAVITVSFMLGFIFPTISDFAQSSEFSYWMLTALVGYMLGVFLKHLPLSYRMSFQSYNPRVPPYLLLLLVGHWFIMLLLFIFSEPALRAILHRPPLGENNTTSGGLMAIAITSSVILTWQVYRRKADRKKRKNYSADRLFYQEIIADFLLVAAVSIMSFAFWEKGVIAMLARAKTQTFRDIWFLFVFLSVMFVFFYLPLRYLYFVEDKVGGRNRRRLFYIFVIMLLRALFELVNL